MDSESPDHSCTPKDWNCLPFFEIYTQVVMLLSWSLGLLWTQFFLFLTHKVCFFEELGNSIATRFLNGDDRQSNVVILSDCTQHWFEGSVSVLCYQSRSNILNDNFVERQEGWSVGSPT